MSVVRVENLTYKYNAGTLNEVTALNNISFEVDKGQIVGIIGKTGSGKSTLVKHLNGLLKSDSGKIFVCEENIWENKKALNRVRFNVGLCFQYPEYQLFAETVLEDIAFGPMNMGKNKEEAQQLAKESAKLLNVDEKLWLKSPFELSGGQKRRVSIAGIIAMKPKVFVLDEPFSSLDPESVEELSNILKEYVSNGENTVIVVSHDMTQMAKICDKILVLNKGEKVLDDVPEKIFEDVNLLKKYGLDIPDITELFLKLSQKGIDINTKVYTVQRAKDIILDFIKRGANA
ncbi:MAG: energy-coupling factor transporter ATPase [Clostridia bacterium]|nr:energy-coupling factor transporter ATPase [Clostridia bacterium]